MSTYKMQLDPAATENSSRHSFKLSPLDTLEQHETPDKLQWLSYHMAPERKEKKENEKKPPGNRKKDCFFDCLIPPVTLMSVLVAELGVGTQQKCERR